jgi:hypothetical protein
MPKSGLLLTTKMLHKARSSDMKRQSQIARWNSPLPGEVWDNIAGHLQLVDTACLSLTCDMLYKRFAEPILHQLKKPSKYTDSVELLFRLYDISPGKTFCQGCLTYHDDATVAKETINATLGVYPNTSAKLCVIEGKHLAFATVKTYAQRAWISNGSGDSRMVNVDFSPNLARSIIPNTGFDLGGGACPFDQSRGWAYEVKIGRERERSHHIMCVGYSRPVTTKVLQTPRLLRMPYICPHAHASPQVVNEVASLIEELPRPWNSEDDDLLSPDREGTLYECAWCPTAVMVETSPIGDRQSVADQRAERTLRISRYVDLSVLGSPHEREWLALTTAAKEGVLETLDWSMSRDDDPVQESADSAGIDLAHNQPADFKVQLTR